MSRNERMRSRKMLDSRSRSERQRECRAKNAVIANLDCHTADLGGRTKMLGLNLAHQ